MPVVTISGQVGSKARDIGPLIAERLGADYVDQQILVEAARALGVPMESVASRDERTAGLGERLATMLRKLLERSAAAGASDPMLGGGLDMVLERTYAEAAAEEDRDISDERYLSTLTGVIRDLAATGNVVILGRGGQAILEDWPGASHVLLVGAEEDRVRDTEQREGLSSEDALKWVRERDKGRTAFHHKFFKIEVDDPSLYHITLNTSRVSPEDAARIICEAAERVAARGQA